MNEFKARLATACRKLAELYRRVDQLLVRIRAAEERLRQRP